MKERIAEIHARMRACPDWDSEEWYQLFIEHIELTQQLLNEEA